MGVAAPGDPVWPADWMLFAGGVCVGAGAAVLVAAAVFHWWENRR